MTDNIEDMDECYDYGGWRFFREFYPPCKHDDMWEPDREGCEAWTQYHYGMSVIEYLQSIE